MTRRLCPWVVDAAVTLQRGVDGGREVAVVTSADHLQEAHVDGTDRPALLEGMDHICLLRPLVSTKLQCLAHYNFVQKYLWTE